VDLVEGDPIAAVVGARRADRDLALGEHVPDDLGDFADLEVGTRSADVEDFVVHALARRIEHGRDGVTVEAAAPRYLPGWATPVVRVPGVREVLTWNLLLVLRKAP
jgi:hypothetical protein